MEHALVVLEENETGRELLREAATLAAGTDAHLDVLALISAEEFAEKQESLDAAAREEHTTYDSRVVLEGVHKEAAETVEDVLDDVDVEWDVVAGRVGDAEREADRILETADEHDADHVFITGQSRSPTGKAVFGDRTQTIILNFDGPVTTLLS